MKNFTHPDFVDKDTDIPFFANTCGKLYPDRIIFASALRETVFKPTEIKKINLSKSVSVASILLILAPSAVFAIPLVSSHEDKWFDYMLYSLGFLMFCIAVFKAEKKYKLQVYLKNGKSVSWHIWKGNIKDVLKFINKAQTLIGKPI